jgi:hypothetical protein
VFRLAARLTAMLNLRRERARQRSRDESWQRLRDAALRNQNATHPPMPSNLLAPLPQPVAPISSLTNEDLANGFEPRGPSPLAEMPDPANMSGSSYEEPARPSLDGEDDQHSDMVRPLSSEERVGLTHCQQKFPETARQQVGPTPGVTPHVRRCEWSLRARRALPKRRLQEERHPHRSFHTAGTGWPPLPRRGCRALDRRPAFISGLDDKRRREARPALIVL